MSDTDFYDDDLVRRPDSSRGELPDEAERDAVRKEAAVLLSKLQPLRDTVEEQVAKTRSELELLRQKQTDLEKETKELEGFRRKQDEYEAGKDGLIEKLRKSLAQLEKEEIRTNQLNEVYVETRRRFIELLAEVEGIDESSWPNEGSRDQLAKAQLQIDQVRVECSKGLARIDALVEASGSQGAAGLEGEDETSGNRSAEFGFGTSMKLGLGIGIPLALLLTAAMVLAQWVGHLLGF